jgi:hypothetical protein
MNLLIFDDVSCICIYGAIHNSHIAVAELLVCVMYVAMLGQC